MNYMDSLENLLTALEIYRDVERQTIGRIKEIMEKHDIRIPAGKEKEIDTEEIRARLAANRRQEMAAEAFSYEAVDLKKR